MKVLIIGSEGFVGNNLVDGLSKNHEIICADQLENSNHKNYYQLDVTNLDDVQRIVDNVDIVIDLAAHSLVSSLDGSIINAKVNIIGLLNILESCRKNQIKKIIFTSASSLVGEPKTFKVSEEHSATPKTAYGITKLTSEHYLRLYSELYGLKYTVFRFFNIYGPYQKNGLIPSLYNRIISKQPLTIFGKGDQIRDYVFIKDIIEFFEKAISSTITDNQILNMGTGEGTTIKELIQVLSDIMQVTPKLDYKPERPGEIGNFVADSKKLDKIFGAIPTTRINTGLSETIAWLKENTGK
jgi:UDP-glucose 4-epimerase